MIQHRFIAVLCPVLLTTAALALASSPQEQKEKVNHLVVRMTEPDANQPAEVAIAINPTRPEHIVATSIQRIKEGNRGAVIRDVSYVSMDGGRTWKTYLMPNEQGRTQGDDVVAFGPDGTVYHMFINFVGVFQKRPKRAENGIWCASSKDGIKWEKAVPLADHINTNAPFEDKPWLVVDCCADSPYRGHLYAAWTKFDVYGSKNPNDKSHIYTTRSRDGGKTFDVPIRISDQPGDAIDDDGTLEGAVPATGPNGEVYVVWAGPRGLEFDKSLDGGTNFGKDRVISDMPGSWSMDVKGIGRANGMPVTGVDCSSGKYRGSLYVNWIDDRNGDPDVFVMYSRDGGETWSKPVRINDDELKNKVEQFFTWMAVDPVDGSINLVFHDRRGLKGTETGVTIARSVDGGETFVNYKVNQKPFTCEPGVFFGDYNGIAAYGGRVVAAYPHFTGPRQLAISAAVFRFRPGTQEIIPPE